MGSQFLEEQAKARGMTVSEMMRERSKKADKSKSGFGRPNMDKEEHKRLSALGGASKKKRK